MIMRLTDPSQANGLFHILSGAARALTFVVFIALLMPAAAILQLFPFKYRDTFVLTMYHGVAWIIGAHVNVRGKVSKAQPTLFVANHTSYLDIIMLGGVLPGSFVAKSDVASWPFLGYMARLIQTVFIERRSSRAAEQRDALGERLSAKQNLILFPEGTSTEGVETLPFKSSLFSLAERQLSDGTPITVQPVSLTCSAWNGMPIHREWRKYYAWFGDMTLIPHLWDMFRFGRFSVNIILHEPVTITAFKNRKELSLHCEQVVRRGMEETLNACAK